jgi:hypothetical protein
MTAAMLTASEPRLDLGWTINATANLIRRRFVDLLIVGLPFVWLPSLLAGFIPREFTALQFLVGIPALVFIGGVSLLTYRDLAGGARVDGAAAIRAGASRFGTLWAVSFISGLMWILGLLLLIAPGIVAMSCLSTASTAAMVEDDGSAGAIGRAWDLSKGSRWRLVGLLALGFFVLIALFLISFIVGVVVAIVGASELAVPIASFGIGPLTSLALTSVTTVGSAAAYVGLRTAKEGPLGDVASTFD